MRQIGRERDAKRLKRLDQVPPERQCSVADCLDRVRGHGYCNKHLKRFRACGDPLGGRNRKQEVRDRRRPNGMTAEETFQWFQPGDPPPAGELWLWRGSQDHKGYGIVRHDGRNILAHRLSYEIFIGPIPDGLVVRHKNDTPLDVNPHNLELGTLIDNVRDREERGRTYRGPYSTERLEQAPRGSRVGLAKLTESDIPKIREYYHRLGHSQASIAKRFDVSQVTISMIVRGKTWTHVP
jgi:DNA-binding XRE family transcriptional regulator